MNKLMNMEKKNAKIQVRITPTEKILLSKVLEINKELSISKIFRDSLYENCKKYKIDSVEKKTRSRNNRRISVKH